MSGSVAMKERLVQNAWATEQWTAIADADLNLLLAAVEAAKDVAEQSSDTAPHGLQLALVKLDFALDALEANDLSATSGTAS